MPILLRRASDCAEWISTLRSPGGAIPAGRSLVAGFLTGAPVLRWQQRILPNSLPSRRGSSYRISPAKWPGAYIPISQQQLSFRCEAISNSIASTHDARFGYNPSDLTGIQDESQNQTLGQNDFSRTGIQTLRDTSFAASLASTISNSVVNEAKFNFGRRKATFDSQIPGAAIQIIGTAFLGSNPFSPVSRTEKRYQFADNLNYIYGNHTFKFGGDINFIDIGARFELNFPGLFNFGGVSGALAARFLDTAVPIAACTATPAPAFCTPPDITPVQSYGFGIPGVTSRLWQSEQHHQEPPARILRAGFVEKHQI